jgi:hypothetical protein
MFIITITTSHASTLASSLLVNQGPVIGPFALARSRSSLTSYAINMYNCTSKWFHEVLNLKFRKDEIPYATLLLKLKEIVFVRNLQDYID